MWVVHEGPCQNCILTSRSFPNLFYLCPKPFPNYNKLNYYKFIETSFPVIPIYSVSLCQRTLTCLLLRCSFEPTLPPRAESPAICLCQKKQACLLLTPMGSFFESLLHLTPTPKGASCVGVRRKGSAKETLFTLWELCYAEGWEQVGKRLCVCVCLCTCLGSLQHMHGCLPSNSLPRKYITIGSPAMTWSLNQGHHISRGARWFPLKRGKPWRWYICQMRDEALLTSSLCWWEGEGMKKQLSL